METYQYQSIKTEQQKLHHVSTSTMLLWRTKNNRAISRWQFKKNTIKSILKVCFAQGRWPYSNTQKMSKQKREIKILFSKAWLTLFSIRILLAPAMIWSWCEARNIVKFHSWPQPFWSWRYAMFMPAWYPRRKAVLTTSTRQGTCWRCVQPVLLIITCKTPATEHINSRE